MLPWFYLFHVPRKISSGHNYFKLNFTDSFHRNVEKLNANQRNLRSVAPWEHSFGGGGAKGSNFPTTRQFFKTNSSDPPFNFMFFKVS